MAPKRDWVDYTNLAANVVQTAQLDGINSKMRQMAELELQKEYREQQEAAVARHEDLLRESVFFFSEQLRDVEEVASQHPTEAYIRASHAKRLYESVPQFTSSGFRKFEDKERMANLQRAYDRMIRESGGRLTPDELEKCNECIEHLFTRKDLLRLIAVAGQAEELKKLLPELVRDLDQERSTLPERLTAKQKLLQAAQEEHRQYPEPFWLSLCKIAAVMCGLGAGVGGITLLSAIYKILTADSYTASDLSFLGTSIFIFAPAFIVFCLLLKGLLKHPYRFQKKKLAQQINRLEFDLNTLNQAIPKKEAEINRFQAQLQWLAANHGSKTFGYYRQLIRERDLLLKQMVGDYANEFVEHAGAVVEPFGSAAPTAGEATDQLADLMGHKLAVLDQSEKLIVAGRFGDAVDVLTKELSRFEDLQLARLRERAEEKQRRVVELSEELIPQSLQENRHVAAQAYLDELVAMSSEAEGAADVRSQIQAAIGKAESCTEKGDQWLAASNPAAALTAFQQALTVCADYEQAVRGVKSATSALLTARNQRWTALVTGVAALLMVLVLASFYILGVQSDDRAWKAASTAAGAAGKNIAQAVTSYQQYLNEFPQGRHAPQAKELIEVTLPQQIDDQAWDVASMGAKNAGTNFAQAVHQYRQYLNLYPQGRHATNAAELVNVTLPQEIDDQAWNEATAGGAAAGTHYEWALVYYRDYLDRFPSGRHAADAKTMVEAGLPQKIVQRDRENAYQTAVSDATMHFQKKEWVLADEAIKKALDIKPDGVEIKQLKEMQPVIASELLNQQYREGLANAQRVLANGQPEQAVVYCKSALAAKPNDPAATQLLQDAADSLKRDKPYQNAMSTANALLYQQKWPEALAAVNAALAVKSGDQAALGLRDKIKEAELNAQYQAAINDTRSLMSQKDWVGASAACNKALTLRPDDQSARDCLAAINKAEHDLMKSAPTLDPAAIMNDVFGNGSGTSHTVVLQFGQGNGSGTSDQVDRKFTARYKGRKIKYSGVVQALLPDENSIMFKGGGTYPMNCKVKGTFPIEDAGKAAKIVKGQHLMILGEINALKASLLGNVIQVNITSVLESPVPDKK